MRYGLSLLVSLTWALWFGGLLTLFLLVSRLFAVVRPTALVAAPQMFIAFEHYQLILAAVALIGTAIWRLTTPRVLLTALFFLFALASVGCITSTLLISPQMHKLRDAGESSGPQFRKLHGQSMMVYTADATILLVAGFVLVTAMTTTAPVARPQTAHEAEPASIPPGGPADRVPSP